MCSVLDTESAAKLSACAERKSTSIFADTSPFNVNAPNDNVSILPLLLESISDPSDVNALADNSPFEPNVNLFVPVLIEFSAIDEFNVTSPVNAIEPVSPNILFVNSPVPKRNTPLFVMSVDTSKSDADILTVADVISKLFCVNLPLNVTLPLPDTTAEPVPDKSELNTISLLLVKFISPSFDIVSPKVVLFSNASTFNVPLLVIPFPLKPLQDNTSFNVNVSSDSIVTPP